MKEEKGNEEKTKSLRRYFIVIIGCVECVFDVLFLFFLMRNLRAYFVFFFSYVHLVIKITYWLLSCSGVCFVSSFIRIY